MSRTYGDLLRESMYVSLSTGHFAAFAKPRSNFLKDIGIENWQQEPSESLDRLGKHLADMFLDAHGGTAGQRDNSTVAIAGALWESLAIAYLNSLLAGTSAVVVKGAAHVPPVLNAMFTISSETGVVSPKYSVFVIDHPCLSETVRGSSTRWDRELTHWTDSSIRGRPDLTSVVLLDCRTNFSDLIKETVLYDWLLNLVSKGYLPDQMLPEYQSHETVEVLPKMKSVSVSLITGVRHQPKLNSAPARRGESLTGRTFWGMETLKGVASCMSEFKERQIGLENLVCTSSTSDQDACQSESMTLWLS